MQDIKDRGRLGDLPFNKQRSLILILSIAIVLVLMIGLGPGSETNMLSNTTTISKAALEEQYGLRVNLVAVTAAGGFVDVRMMILDGEKAKPLLDDPGNFPALSVEGVTLQVSEQAREQEIKYEENSTLFIMFPNAGNSVRKGMPVTIRFGKLALEPIDAQ